MIGATVTSVEARGKHLLIGFDSGLELRSHLGMHGSWHRYRPGDRWRRPPARAHLVLEVPGSVAVLFDAASMDLFEVRAEHLHPILSRLGPDLSSEAFDAVEALRRLDAPAQADRTIAEALIDQRITAGGGNVYKSEVLFIERVDPFSRVADVDAETRARLIATAHRLLLANRTTLTRTTTMAAGDQRTSAGATSRRPRSPLWVYGRAGRPCFRCSTLVAVRRHGDLPRQTYWCPGCQTGLADRPGERTLIPRREKGDDGGEGDPAD
jgi:endonuclease-8